MPISPLLIKAVFKLKAFRDFQRMLLFQFTDFCQVDLIHGLLEYLDWKIKVKICLILGRKCCQIQLGFCFKYHAQLLVSFHKGKVVGFFPQRQGL